MRHTLPNGLTLLVEENHAAPVVAIQVWMRVGSADEGPDEAGIAHLALHDQEAGVLFRLGVLAHGALL